MTKLRLSTADQFSATHYLQSVTEAFGHENQCEIAIEFMPWDTMLTTLKNIAFTKGKMDLSEIGSTWVSKFASRNALRPFTPEEVAQIGGPDTFLPSVWQHTPSQDNQVWSIPWLSDMRVIYYWRDALDEAGADEAYAFQSIDQIEDTFARLAAYGITPWSAITQVANNTLYNIASWVWGMGSDFISPDGQHTQFGDANALQGMAAYFGLHRYLPQTHSLISQRTAEEWFVNREVAATLSGPWLLTYLAQKEATRDLLPRLGIALPPGPSFVGGTHLVVWQHMPPEHEQFALQLIELLTSYEVQRSYAQLFGRMLPVRQDALHEVPYSMERHFQVFYDTLYTGRTFPAIPMWADIEEQLIKAFGKIWERILANPDGNIEAMIEQQLKPMERLLDRMLCRS